MRSIGLTEVPGTEGIRATRASVPGLGENPLEALCPVHGLPASGHQGRQAFF